MKLKTRVLEKTILKAIKTFPVIVVTGPRQSGKTTLFRRFPAFIRIKKFNDHQSQTYHFFKENVQ